jgi:hypothetical protein
MTISSILPARCRVSESPSWAIVAVNCAQAMAVFLGTAGEHFCNAVASAFWEDGS